MVCKIKRDDFYFDDQPRRSFGINYDIVRTLVQNISREFQQKREIVERLNIDRSTAFRHLKKIGYTLKLDMWVPHLLTEANKLIRVSAAVSLLDRLNKESFLDRLVTSNEK